MALTDSLISYWTMDETSGTRYDSVVATGNDLTDNNTVGYGTGIISNGADFIPANSEYLSHTSNASLQTGDIDFTFAAWFKIDDLNTRAIISKDDGLGTRDYRITYLAGALRFYVNASGATQVASAAAISTGTWYYVVAWHDASANTINIQVNNGTVDSAGIGALSAASTNPFLIGANTVGSATNFWDGLIDEVGFWKRVLTSDERTSLYNSGAGLAYPFGGGPPATPEWYMAFV